MCHMGSCIKCPGLVHCGGSARVVKKPNCFFEKSIFQRVFRIILGPPKHVSHLVWSANLISAAIRACFILLLRPRTFLGILSPGISFGGTSNIWVFWSVHRTLFSGGLPACVEVVACLWLYTARPLYSVYCSLYCCAAPDVRRITSVLCFPSAHPPISPPTFHCSYML